MGNRFYMLTVHAVIVRSVYGAVQGRAMPAAVSSVAEPVWRKMRVL